MRNVWRYVKEFVSPIWQDVREIAGFIWTVLKEVRGLFLLLLTFLMGLAFEMFREPNAVRGTYPDNHPLTHAYFLFSDMELYRDTHWFFILQHSSQFVIALYIVVNSRKHHTANRIFALICFISIIDYLLCYGEPWLKAGFYEISWDTLRTPIFTLAIMNEIFLVLEKMWAQNGNAGCD